MKTHAKREGALILVDLQIDFLPGGTLAVPDGDRVIPVANRLMDRFEIVVATQDWHPPDHCSFAASHPGLQVGERIRIGTFDQQLWPVHCVEHTPGAEFSPGLQTSRIDAVFRKGIDKDLDSYSTFFDNLRQRDTGLDLYLKMRSITHVFVLGLATDYCVRFSALDALGLGYDTAVITDGCRGIDLEAGDSDRALAEIRSGGGRLVQSEDLLEA